MAVHDMLMAAGGVSTGGATYVDDVFSTYLYTGNGSGQVIENGINLGTSNSGGSAYFDGTSSSLTISNHTSLQFGSGDFVLEAWILMQKLPEQGGYVFPILSKGTSGVDFSYGLYIRDGQRVSFGYAQTNGGGVAFKNSTNTAIPAGSWAHILYSRSGSTLYSFVNGSLISTHTVDFSTINSGGDLTIGSIDTLGYLCDVRIRKGVGVSSSFTPPSAPLTAVSGTSLLCCQGDAPFTDKSSNTLSITRNGAVKASVVGPFTSATAGKGGMVWLKSRSVAANNLLTDTVRGVSSVLRTNLTGAAVTTSDDIASFNANGFSLTDPNISGNGNYAGSTYASWTFRKQEKFFDVVTYTGNGSFSRNISHSLGSTPGFIIIKKTSSTGNWISIARKNSTTYYTGLFLNTTDAASSEELITDVATSTTVDVGYLNAVVGATNDNGATYVAYLFAHDAGGFGATGTDNVISCGSFTTNSSGNFSVNLGYEPQWLLYKKSSEIGNWELFDNMRGWNVGYKGQRLYANLSNAEGSAAFNTQPDSTGFSGSNGGLDINSTYIYIAIRRPMKPPTTGTSVFSPVLGANTSTGALIYNTGFPVDMLMQGYQAGGANNAVTVDRLRGSPFLSTSLTDAEATPTYVRGFASNSGVVAVSGFDYTNIVGWSFRRAPGFFDVVCYTGTGSATTVTHNLGVAPEFVIVKSRTLSGADWQAFHKGLNGGTNPWNYSIYLNSNSTEYSYAGFNNTAPTSSVFSLGTNGGTNQSGETYVSYLFATLPGVSKVGSYTGTGSSIDIDCGFSGGARFIILKRTTSSGQSWYVWDSVRGIVSGNDPFLLLNSTASEYTSYDYIDPYAAGFTVNSGISVAGENYVYLAIA